MDFTDIPSPWCHPQVLVLVGLFVHCRRERNAKFPPEVEQVCLPPAPAFRLLSMPLLSAFTAHCMQQARAVHRAITLTDARPCIHTKRGSARNVLLAMCPVAALGYVETVLGDVHFAVNHGRFGSSNAGAGKCDAGDRVARGAGGATPGPPTHI